MQLRERKNLPAKCEACPVVAECGGGCPLQFENHRRDFGVNKELIAQEVPA
jgi:radical SAM protein with 4Fe4S-binding SPASM domain